MKKIGTLLFMMGLIILVLFAVGVIVLGLYTAIKKGETIWAIVFSGFAMLLFGTLMMFFSED